MYLNYLTTPSENDPLNKEKAMVDYFKLPANHNLLKPAPEEDQAAPDPIVVDVVFNTHEERNGKTIALKISFRLPLKS